jgi:hypothetical protein
MRKIIIDAINNRQILTFIYSGIHRVVEPHAVGISSTGNEVLRCYQTKGGHISLGHEWDLCDLQKIHNIQVATEQFREPRPHYKRGDKGMIRIFAQL